MQLTFISDTHGEHPFLHLTGGDVLIHCGDFSSYGDLDEVEDFAQFIAKQAFAYKIVIAGNHDRSFDDERRATAEALLQNYGIIYLCDSGIEIDGKYFWGSPIQPEFCNWAFNRSRGEVLQQHWLQIPPHTDILITHTPAYGILDLCYDGTHVGCEALREAVERIQPAIHACGHIHESYGQCLHNDTVFINACCLDEHYRFKNPPIVVEI